ncbi:type II toxin-antitoxin system RelE/ParE family toxin [Asticcacaulis endophyticus]|uniref:Plasmid stabilization protein n=1 Tax=Asticcacaulis endophyticus TaxID=1395890 RepID=A0A918Q102_9CAUL|nr:type II toxin-antitoxin system RelE/ParE family toxin [Asticcacaulis endophyticus]GGZ26938.1 plasmid stabilization protein [Asticcacaulis endophyticus]
MIFTLTKFAAQDIEDIGDFIALNNPARALSFIEEIHAACRALIDTPAAYPAIVTLGDNIRRAPFQRYLIFYAGTASELRIVRVLHSARDINAQMFVV